MGVWAGVSAGGAAVGVLLGGFLTQYLNWRWNFFVNVPVGIIVVFGALRLLPHHIGEENRKVGLDLAGATLATVGLMSLVYGLSKAPNNGWDSLTVQGFIAAGLALLVVVVITVAQLAKQPVINAAGDI
jgi:MFS family permease